MTSSPAALFQAAAEYGSATSVAGEVSNSFGVATGSARRVFEALSSNPVLLVGVLLVFVLLFLFFRDPAR